MKLAFVGGGNMATAMIGGLRRAGVALASVDVLEIDAAKGAQLEREQRVSAHTAAGSWLQKADVVVLAVKPQQVQAALADIAAHVAHALVISIAAGVRSRTLAQGLGHRRIVRAMPNTPALIGAGITGAVALSGVDAPSRATAESILGAVGPVIWFNDEAQLDTVTAVSGSGPAYVFYLIEALEAAAIERGLDPQAARSMAIATFAGAAQLAAQSSESPAVLRDRVTSRGGTTAAALERLRAAKVDASIADAVRAAEARAREMGDELESDPPATPSA